MKCQKCQKFDDETKKRVLECFGPDEVASIAANFIHQNHSARTALKFINPNNGTPQNLKARIHYDRQIEFTGHIIGKCLVALEPEAMAELIKAFNKMNIKINIQHESCPHPNVEDAEFDHQDDVGVLE